MSIVKKWRVKVNGNTIFVVNDNYLANVLSLLSKLDLQEGKLEQPDEISIILFKED